MRYAVLAAPLLLASCPNGPLAVVPGGGVPGAVAYSPPSDYAAYWYEMEQCTGLRGDLRAVAFYRVQEDGPGYFECPGVTPSGLCFGRYIAREHAIYMAASRVSVRESVAHEMIHALGVRGHPVSVFDGCGIGILL